MPTEFSLDDKPDAEVAACLAVFETLTVAQQRGVVHYMTWQDRDHPCQTTECLCADFAARSPPARKNPA